MDRQVFDNTVFLSDIESMQWAMGVDGRSQELMPSKPVMAGHFKHHSFHDGLTVHASDAIETQDSRNSFELPAGLSFNFVFAGEVDFTFSGQRHQLCLQEGHARCTAIVNNTPEVMSRRMRRGMHVKKLNIFVERRWLEKRNASTADAQLLQNIFAQAKIYHWFLDESMQAKAERLLQIKSADLYAEKLELEYLTMQLLASCIDQLGQRLEQVAILSKSSVDERDLTARLITVMDDMSNQQMGGNVTLAELAASLGMSERTLQRKFKKQYGETVSSFVRARNMEKAKRALIVDGKTIGEAAYIAGYNHASNFVSAFKKSFALTPAEFTKRYR